MLAACRPLTAWLDLCNCVCAAGERTVIICPALRACTCHTAAHMCVHAMCVCVCVCWHVVLKARGRELCHSSQACNDIFHEKQRLCPSQKVSQPKPSKCTHGVARRSHWTDSSPHMRLACGQCPVSGPVSVAVLPRSSKSPFRSDTCARMFAVAAKHTTLTHVHPCKHICHTT